MSPHGVRSTFARVVGLFCGVQLQLENLLVPENINPGLKSFWLMGWVDEIYFVTMVGSIPFVGICNGIESDTGDS